MHLTIDEKNIILNIARNSIKNIFIEDKLEITDLLERFPILLSNSGVFVTLTINGKLRGCIGYIISNDPLFETISSAAVQAATGDPRFLRLTLEEFKNIKVEVSILSEPFLMNSYDDIVLGKHGVILEEPRRALLLPQVPIEHNMNKEQFLNALCQKAGLYPEYWKEEKLKMSLFTANVFSEDNLGETNE